MLKLDTNANFRLNSNIGLNSNFRNSNLDVRNFSLDYPWVMTS
jgi:hypothetical protein